MARPLRLQFPGAVYHVMSRGIERRPIVRDDADRKRWIQWLQRTVDLSRAVAAYLARRRYGYPATAVAAALGYRGHISVHYAIARLESDGGLALANRIVPIEKELPTDY